MNIYHFNKCPPPSLLYCGPWKSILEPSWSETKMSSADDIPLIFPDFLVISNIQYFNVYSIYSVYLLCYCLIALLWTGELNPGAQLVRDRNVRGRQDSVDISFLVISNIQYFNVYSIYSVYLFSYCLIALLWTGEVNPGAQLIRDQNVLSRQDSVDIS